MQSCVAVSLTQMSDRRVLNLTDCQESGKKYQDVQSKAKISFFQWRFRALRKVNTQHESGMMDEDVLGV